MKDRVVLAFDPGYVNGCKIAVVDETGKVNGRGAYIKKDLEVLEKARNSKILEKRLECSIARREKLLSNENYVAKAPANIVDQERKNLEEEKESLIKGHINK